MSPIRRILLSIGAAAVMCYAIDYAVVRARGAAGLDVVTVKPYYAVTQRNLKTEEIIALDPVETTCVRSLLPHMGHPACWWLRRHVQKRIEM